MASAPPQTVHRIEVPGHPGDAVEFVKCRAMNGRLGYIVRFPGDAETKEPLVSIDTSIRELKRGTSVELLDGTLTVYGPQGQWVQMPGYVPAR